VNTADASLRTEFLIGKNICSILIFPPRGLTPRVLGISLSQCVKSRPECAEILNLHIGFIL
jgi:hypothetical protein